MSITYSNNRQSSVPQTKKTDALMQKESLSACGLFLDHITVSLAEKQLLSVSLTINPGEIATVMGPSGSGKSTLLAYIGGFLAPEFTATGQVRLGGEDICIRPAHERKIGILFQDPLLFPHLSVGQNLLFGLDKDIKGKQRRKERVCDALQDINLGDFFDRDPATLSGGQKARVALARILLSQPKALLLDEPFSKLDASLRAQMRKWVFDKAKAHSIPILLVTHDQDDAKAANGPLIDLGQQDQMPDLKVSDRDF